MDSATLYQRAASEVEKAQAIQELADKEERELTDEEQSHVSDYCDAAERYRAQADTAKKLEATAQLVDAPHPGAPRRLGGQPITDPDNRPGPRLPAQPVDQAAEDRFHFDTLGQFAQVCYAAQSGGRLDQRLEKYALDRGVEFLSAGSGMEQATGSLGGFLVPPAFSQQIWDGLNAADNNILAMCDSYTVTGESLTFPANAETSRANGSRWGGIRGYWIAEAAQITSSKPTLRQVKVEPQELAILCYVTDKLLRNATALQQYLVRAATSEILFKTGDALVNGTGAGQPLGITAAGCMIAVAKETSQAADTIVAQNIRKMRARLHFNSWNRAVWMVNQDCLPELDNLFTQVTNVAGSENVGGFDPRLYDPNNMTLLGRPIIVSEFCATVGDAYDILLCDWSSYLAGVRGGVRSDMSIHLRFDYAETAFRFMYEVDGRPWLQSALTPYKGTNTLSTFVSLAARA